MGPTSSSHPAPRRRPLHVPALIAHLVVATLFSPHVTGAKEPEAPGTPLRSEKALGAAPLPGRIEEIRVTSRKRTEFLQDTPVAVTVVKPEDLRQSGTIYLPQIQNLVPNLSIVPRRDGASFVIRGIGAFPQPYFDQGVGLYIDNVFIPRQQGNITELIDVEQIEVLRGPQGTLFGKNSEGGAVRISTVKPTDEYEGMVRVRASSLYEVQTRAMLNVPVRLGWLKDKLAVRLNYGSSHREDWVYNEYLDQGMNGWDNYGVLGSLRFQPTEDLVFDFTALWNKTAGKGGAPTCTYIQPSAFAEPIDFRPDPSRGGIGPRYDYDQDSYREACERSERYRVSIDTPQRDETRTKIIWGTARWDADDVGLLEDVSVQFISSYRSYETAGLTDLDGTEFRIFEADSTGENPDGGRPETGWSITEELQVNAAALDGRLNFVAGVFGYYEKVDQEGLVLTFPGTIAELGGGRFVGEFGAENWDWSIYSQGDFAVTDWLQVTAGVRYAQEKKTVDRLVTWPESTGVFPGPFLCQPGTGPGFRDENDRAVPCVQVPMFPGVDFSNRVPASGQCREGTGPVLDEDTGQFVATEAVCDPEPWRRSVKFKNFSPMAAVRLTAPDDWLEATPLDHLMVYFQYARGYKGGGFNGGALDSNPSQFNAFAPEFVDSYEIGFKTNAFEDRVTFNVTAFYADYRDLQLPFVETIPPPEGCMPSQELIDQGLTECLPTAVVVTRNAADAEIKGLEIEMRAWPTPFLNLQADIGLQDARTKQFRNAENPLTGLPEDISGQRFSFIPRWNVHLAAMMPLPLQMPDTPWLSGFVTPRVDYNYRSEVQWFSPRLNEGATPNAALQPSIHLLSARVTYLFHDGKMAISAFGENLTDERSFGVLALGQRTMGTINQFWGPGRAWGGSITYRF